MIVTLYTQTVHGYFWQWEEDGQVAALAVTGSNATIAWRAYIAEVLQLLAPQGIPPLGTLLAAIVATNPKGAENINLIADALSNLAKQNKDEDILTDACKFLKVLAALPDDIKAGNNRKLVFQSIFQRSHKLLTVKDSAICARYMAQNQKVHITALPIYTKPNIIRVEFRPLALLAAKFKTVDALIEHLAPVDWLPPEEIELPSLSGAEERPVDFLSDLLTNPQTQKIGSLVPHLWAGLNIPLHASHAGGMPLGGVADITNKGDLDRLLVSEYANEDWLLLSRLAGNEALYWRREVPPAHNDRDRVLLLDTTIRMWGTPRLVALALAVSLTHHPRSTFNYHTFAVGASFRALTLHTIGQLLGAMQEMDAALTASKGIDQWFAKNAPKTGVDVVLITAEPNLRQPDFLQTLAKLEAIKTLLIVGNEGAVDYFNITKAGRSHRQHLALPLQNLWKKKDTVEPDLQSVISDIPLRYANAPTDRSILVTEEGGIFQITREKNLFYHPGFKTMHLAGWILMTTGIPIYNRHFSVGALPNGDFLLLIFDRNTNTIDLRNLATKQSETIKFPHWQPTDYPSFIFVKDSFFHKNYSGSWQICPSGQVTVVPSLQLSLFSDADAKIKETDKKIPGRHTILRNIHTIYINSTGNLVVNVHELIVKRNAHIKFEKTKDEQQSVVANVDQKSVFTFPDGSTIENHISGVLILQSSNRKLPTIYVPSVVAASIAMSTVDTFTGNQYYRSSINGLEMPVISVEQFYATYFTPFIKHILLSGNSRKS